MNCINQVILEGNAVNNAVFYGDVMVTAFTIATNRTYKKTNGETELETSYFDVKFFGTSAEHIASEITKGRGVRVGGRLKQERWTDSDGKHCAKAVVIADRVELKPMVKKEA